MSVPFFVVSVSSTVTVNEAVLDEPLVGDLVYDIPVGQVIAPIDVAIWVAPLYAITPQVALLGATGLPL